MEDVEGDDGEISMGDRGVEDGCAEGRYMKKVEGGPVGVWGVADDVQNCAIAFSALVNLSTSELWLLHSSVISCCCPEPLPLAHRPQPLRSEDLHSHIPIGDNHKMKINKSLFMHVMTCCRIFTTFISCEHLSIIRPR